MNDRSDYRTTYQELFHRDLPPSVTWETSNADILSPGRGFMDGFDSTMQLQVGCPCGCLFCYVATAARLAPKDIRGQDGRNWGFRVRPKTRVLHKVSRHLQRGSLADKTIYWSGVTDPYASAPRTTRAIWQLLLSAPQALRPRRIVVQTRLRPDRDGALMQQYNASTPTRDGGPAVMVSFSIGTDRNDLITEWERATPRFEQRMQAVHSLRQSGVFVVATLSPMGLWHDLEGTLIQFEAWGVAYLTCLFFKEKTASANTPPLFLDYLRQKYPSLLDPEWQAQQVQTMQAVYGPACVLVGRAGFDSLAHPHTVVPIVAQT